MNPTGKETLDLSCLLCAKELFEIPAVGCRPDTVTGTNEKTVENESEGTPTNVRLAFRPRRELGTPTK
jgi:hypothetical protein